MRESTFEAVMERAMVAIGSTKWSDLARELGMSTGDLSNRKGRNTLPYDRLIQLANSRNVSVDWLLTGREPMRRKDAGQTLSPREEAVLGLFRDLDEADRQEIFQVAQEKKRLREIERKVAELSAQLARRDAVP